MLWDGSIRLKLGWLAYTDAWYKHLSESLICHLVLNTFLETERRKEHKHVIVIGDCALIRWFHEDGNWMSGREQENMGERLENLHKYWWGRLGVTSQNNPWGTLHRTTHRQDNLELRSHGDSTTLSLLIVCSFIGKSFVFCPLYYYVFFVIHRFFACFCCCGTFPHLGINTVS